VCLPSGTFEACYCRGTDLRRLREGMVGTWQGVQSNPWTNPYKVGITFAADGHYSVRCAQPACPAPVFYWGLDEDSQQKVYELEDVTPFAPRSGFGTIDVTFFPDSVVGDNSQSGTFEELGLSPDGTRLTFEFWGDWSDGKYGPLVFDLTRLP
jgi:hypothetical protein